jgi:hypothetical protein
MLFPEAWQAHRLEQVISTLQSENPEAWEWAEQNGRLDSLMAWRLWVWGIDKKYWRMYRESHLQFELEKVAESSVATASLLVNELYRHHYNNTTFAPAYHGCTVIILAVAIPCDTTYEKAATAVPLRKRGLCSAIRNGVSTFAGRLSSNSRRRHGGPQYHILQLLRSAVRRSLCGRAVWQRQQGLRHLALYAQELPRRNIAKRQSCLLDEPGHQLAGTAQRYLYRTALLSGRHTYYAVVFRSCAYTCLRFVYCCSNRSNMFCRTTTGSVADNRAQELSPFQIAVASDQSTVVSLTIITSNKTRNFLYRLFPAIFIHPTT